MSQIIDLATIMVALQQIEARLAAAGDWLSGNAEQAHLLTVYKLFGQDAARLEDVEAKASPLIDELNTFLQQHGFSIQLQPIPDPKGFGVVAILDRAVKWLTAGEPQNIRFEDGTNRPGFRLAQYGARVVFRTVRQYLHPLACIPTQTGDTVWLTFADVPLEGLALADKIIDLATAEKSRCLDYNGVVIPNVQLDEQPNIGFLLGLGIHDPSGQYWFIQQALQQVKFKMDRFGAHVQAATAAAVMRGMPKPDLVFDRPFYVWMIGREGGELPILMAYID